MVKIKNVDKAINSQVMQAMDFSKMDFYYNNFSKGYKRMKNFIRESESIKKGGKRLPEIKNTVTTSRCSRDNRRED